MRIRACLIGVSLLLGLSPTASGQERGVVVVVHVSDGTGHQQARETQIYANSYALLIGNTEYQNRAWNDLPDVGNDLAAVKEVLESKHGFKVEVALNQTRSTLLRTIDQFISRYGPNYNNRLLIYYSGHGYTALLPDERKMGYLVLPDAPPMPSEDSALRVPPSDEEFENFLPAAVTMDEIETYARRITAKHVLFVFDSCFSGTVLRKDMGTSVPTLITTEELKPVRAYLTAGNEIQRVPAFSRFRRKFVAGLMGEADTNRDGYILSSELGRWISIEVQNDTARRQTPVFGKSEMFNRGDVVFVSPKESARPTPDGPTAHGPAEPDFGPTASAAENERQAFVSVQNSTSVSDIRAVLEEYPKSRYAGDLRKRLDRLVWESLKNSRDRARLQAYLDEFGEQGQFAPLARIEIKKLTPVQPKPSPAASGTGGAPSAPDALTERLAAYSRAASLAEQALSEVIIGNDESAKKLAEDALRLNGNMPLALAVDGWAKEELIAAGKTQAGTLDSVRIDLEGAVKLDPKNPFLRARLIAVYQGLGKSSQSESAAKKVLSLLKSPVTALDYFSLGLAHYGLGKNVEAAYYFTKAVEFNPKFAHAYFARGQVRLLSDLNAARADFLKAVEINPRFWTWNGSASAGRTASYVRLGDSYDSKGWTLYQAEKYDEAISEFTKAIGIFPAISYYQNRGVAYYYKKDYDAAIRDFDVVLKSDPDWSGKDLYYMRAYSYSEKGDCKQAVADYTKSIEHSPTASAHNNRGVCYSNDKNYEAAIREYTRAIQLDPNDGLYYRNRASLYDATGRGGLAEADRREAVAADQRKEAEKQKNSTENCTCPVTLPQITIPVQPPG